MKSMDLSPIRVGLLGIGTVGSGTFNVLQRNQEEIRRRAGRGIEITMVADLDVARARAVVGDGVQVVDDARKVIADPARCERRWPGCSPRCPPPLGMRSSSD